MLDFNYTPASNSVAEKTLLTATLAANSLASGDILRLAIAAQFTNGTGADTTAAIKFYLGSHVGTLAAALDVKQGAINKVLFEITLQRVGTEIWAYKGLVAREADIGANKLSPDAGDNIVAITSVDFTINNLLKLTCTFAAADATIVCTPRVATYEKISNT